MQAARERHSERESSFIPCGSQESGMNDAEIRFLFPHWKSHHRLYMFVSCVVYSAVSFNVMAMI